MGRLWLKLGAALPVILTGLCWPSQACAQEDKDLRAKTQNPVGSLYSVPLENNFDFGAPNGGAYILNIQPVIPITVGGVNLINRVIIPIASVQGFIEGLRGSPRAYRETARRASATSTTRSSSHRRIQAS